MLAVVNISARDCSSGDSGCLQPIIATSPGLHSDNKEKESGEKMCQFICHHVIFAQLIYVILKTGAPNGSFREISV